MSLMVHRDDVVPLGRQSRTEEVKRCSIVQPAVEAQHFQGITLYGEEKLIEIYMHRMKMTHTTKEKLFGQVSIIREWYARKDQRQPGAFCRCISHANMRIPVPIACKRRSMLGAKSVARDEVASCC